jgi:uncharacterized damage-inducible protein DinB
MAENPTELEVWQRGPIDGVPPLLQPVAHALLQAVEDIEKEMAGFPLTLLWSRPAQVASVGFHLKHARGVVDRLFTYARAEMLSENQMQFLKRETEADDTESVEKLVNDFRMQVSLAIDQLRTTEEATLNEKRGIGRKQIPTTIAGLLFHAAEHVQRHVGQLIVTSRILKSMEKQVP